MTRQWWLLIQEKYPLALEECIKDFQRIHKDKWREVIQQREWLSSHFQSKGIHIETRNIDIGEGPRYGSKVGGKELQVWRTMRFNSIGEATLDAFYLAFWIREEELTNDQGTTRKKIP